MSDNECVYVKHAQSSVEAAQIALQGALQFRDQLAAKDAEMQDLRKEIAELRQDLYFTKANLAQRDVAFAQQRADWAKAVTDRDAARAEIAELRKCLDECDKLRSDAITARNDVIQQNATLSFRMAHHITRADKAVARVAECEEAVDQAVALAEYLEGHSKGAMAERVKTALSAKFAQDRKRERDEARAELAEWNALGTAVIYGGVPARDTPTLWPNPWRQTIAMVAWAHHDIAGQRDDARECVRRLCAALQSIHEFADYGRIRDQAGEALAATPEHLR